MNETKKVERFDKVDKYLQERIRFIEEQIEKEKVIVDNLKETLKEYRAKYQEVAIAENKTLGEMKNEFTFRDYLVEQIDFHIDMTHHYEIERDSYTRVYHQLWN